MHKSYQNSSILRIITAFLVIIVMIASLPNIAHAKSNTIKRAPYLKAFSVTVIGDSVTLGAAIFSNLRSRIAKTSGISWCKTDCRVSRRLADGIKEIKKLKKAGKLGKIVVISLSTNGSFSYDEAKKALKAVGKDRYLIFVTGYKKGHKYTNKTNKAVKKLAKNQSRVYVADWNSFIAKKKKKNLAGDGCHLNNTSGKWFTDIIIDTLKETRKDSVEKYKNDRVKKAKLTLAGNIVLVPGSSVIAPAGYWGSHIGSRKINWSSSDPTIATIDANGRITALADGNTVITAWDPKKSSEKISFTVSVNANAPAPNALNTNITKVNDWTLKLTATPNAGAAGVPTFSSSNTSIVKVNKAGLIIGNKEGKANITVKYGNISKKVSVTVKAK